MVAIIQHPDPRLREAAFPVEDLHDIRRVARDLTSAIATHPGESAAGLAAPQIGIPLRIAIVRLNGTWITIANPAVVEESDETNVRPEGCLSLPAGQRWDVERPNRAVVTYENRDRRPCRLPLRGDAARLFLHEIDHLDGILVLDRARDRRADPAIR